MYLRAYRQVQGRSTEGYWKVLLNDWAEKRFYVYAILLSLPPPIIRSLIQNTLVYDIVNHRDVASFVFHFMEPTPLSGIYMNSPIRLSGIMHQFTNSGNSAQNGKGLSVKESGSCYSTTSICIWGTVQSATNWHDRSISTCQVRASILQHWLQTAGTPQTSVNVRVFVNGQRG